MGLQLGRLFARDTNHALLRRFAATVDGQYQTLGAQTGEYNLQNFFDADPDTKRLVAHLSADDIDALNRGGHDLRKLYAPLRPRALTADSRPSS